MKRTRPLGRHLDTRVVIDFLEQRLDAAERTRVEEHLASPCTRCRESLRAAGEVLEIMRRDRTPQVPESLHRIALDAFASVPRSERAPGLARRLAKLIFDSAATPAPAVARRAVGESRLLRFAADPWVLEMECEAESASELTLRGRLAAPDPALYRIDLEVGAERRTARPDADGAFAVEGLPQGRLRVTVLGPAGRHRLPSFRL